MSGMKSVQKAVPATALALLLAVAGCDGASPGTPGRPTTPPSTVSTQGADLRTRLTQAFQSTSPATALLIKDSDSTLNEVKLDGLSGWTLVDVQNQRPPHPRRVAVALSDSGQGKLLSGHPDALNAVLSSNLKELDAGRAVTAAKIFLDLTRDTTTWSYRVESVEQIKWLPQPDAAQTNRRHQLIAEFKDRVSAPEAVAASGGWALTLWTVRGSDLVQHKIIVGSDGSITDHENIAAADLPVPGSI